MPSPSPTSAVSAPPTRPRAAARVLRAGVWGMLALLLGYFIFTLPAYYRYVATLAIVSDPAYKPVLLANLAQMGVGVGFYAAWYVALALMVGLACLAMAALLLAVRPAEPIALFTACMLGLFGVTFAVPTDVLAGAPLWANVTRVLSAASVASGFLFLCIFPTGGIVPRALRLPAWLVAGYLLFTGIAPVGPWSPEGWPNGAYALFTLAWVLLGLSAQVLRYRRAGSTARAQARWVISGFVAALAGYAVVMLLGVLLPNTDPGTPAELLATTLAALIALLIPASIAIAVLRYHLFDIDLVIRRTLQYSIVSLLLAAVYLGSVLLLQQAFQTWTQRNSQAAIALSTLGIAALFRPLRLGVQRWVDARFHRRHYDLTRVLVEFGRFASDETDLDKLRGELERVVVDTLQPERTWVWLREAAEIAPPRPVMLVVAAPPAVPLTVLPERP